MTARKIVVIGAGIVGTSIAYHLAKRGQSVTLVDRAAPASGASGASFAWINASFDNPEPYYRLRLQSLFEWRRLEAELEGRLQVKWGGSLMWEEDMPGLEAEVRRHQSWGYPVRMVGRDVFADLEPRVANPPAVAAFSECEGSLDCPEAIGVMLSAAADFGAVLRQGVAVQGFKCEGQRLTAVETDNGDLAADTVVLAAGSDSHALADRLGIHLPMENSPGVLIHSKPVDAQLNRLVLSPSLHMKQDPSGVIVAGENFGGGPVPADYRRECERLFDAVRQRLPGAAGLELDRITLGQRVMPKGGMPAVGALLPFQGLYIAVMHSGVTLAPIVGRLAASEILDEIEAEMLAPYRPSRFN